MIETAYYNSPIGVFKIMGTKLGIQSVQLKPDMSPQNDPVPEVLKNCVQQLNEYFYRRRTEFDLKLDFGGASNFYKNVWNELLKVPYGHTTSYSYIADKIGDLKAVRAVGMANKNNPIAIIVPCHRIIAKNGDLQGYFYGLDIKRKLLELENPMSFAEQGSLF